MVSIAREHELPSCHGSATIQSTAAGSSVGSSQFCQSEYEKWFIREYLYEYVSQGIFNMIACTMDPVFSFSVRRRRYRHLVPASSMREAFVWRACFFQLLLNCPLIADAALSAVEQGSAPVRSTRGIQHKDPLISDDFVVACIMIMFLLLFSFGALAPCPTFAISLLPNCTGIALLLYRQLIMTCFCRLLSGLSFPLHCSLAPRQLKNGHLENGRFERNDSSTQRPSLTRLPTPS